MLRSSLRPSAGCARRFSAAVLRAWDLVWTTAADLIDLTTRPLHFLLRPLPEAVPNTVLANAFRGVAEDDVGALATALDADTGIARACTSDGVSLLMEV